MTKTVLALGGCGGVGQHAVPALLDLAPHVRVVLADRDEDRARTQAKAYGDRVDPRTVDVTDEVALAEALSQVDTVMNMVGPFFRFGPPILRAAIRAHCDYIDICDDPDPTLAMLGMDGAATDAGIRAILGMGITPGVSNLLAVVAMHELDHTRRLVTGWDVEAALPNEIREQPSAATVHGVEQLTGTIHVRRGGAFVDEAPVRREQVSFPGLGSHPAWTIGHPEPVTLPRAFPEIEDCVNVMVTRRSQAVAMRALGWFVNRRLVSRERAAWLAERVEGVGGRTPTLEDWLESGSRGLPPIFALAEGERDGSPASVGAMLLSAPAGGLGGTTGVPLAVGTAMLLDGASAGPGVHAPETAFEPAAFFARLAPRCAPPRVDGEQLLHLARSWADPDLLEDLHRRA